MSMMTRSPRSMGVGDQGIRVGEGAELRLDVAVVGDVVAAVGHR
jgi:hypothetical protein